MLRSHLALTGVVALVLVAAAVPAFAKGGKPSDPSITLNAPYGYAPALEPALGSTVTFTTVYPGNTKNPRVQVQCFQSGALVYAESGSPTWAFQLGGAWSQWLLNGGAASCKADLLDLYYQGGQQQATLLASTSFDATG